MNYEETLNYIHDTTWRGKKRTLSRVRELLEKLGNPQRDLKFVHIAGTNGKGSTSACMESILRHAGYKTGLYTSPFITRFNERMQICGQQISDDELVKITEYVKPYAERMEDHPTEFELITAIAMKYFKDNGCDIVVLEVGMGGELDSTNVIDAAEVDIITAMGYDHVKELGPDMASIAAAKAGIIKRGADVVIYGGDDEADAVFERVCAERNAKLYKTDFTGLNIHEYSLTGTRFDYNNYKDLYISLAGTYQPRNAAVVITAVEVLRAKGWRIKDADVYAGLSNASWPGRFELIMSEPVFVIDGAHNPHGVNAAAESIRTLFRGKKPVFLIGVMADKDVEHMSAAISELAKNVVAVKPDNKRAMDAKTLAEYFTALHIPVKDCGTVQEGVREAIAEAGRDGIVVALGSLYFSSDVRAAVKRLY